MKVILSRKGSDSSKGSGGMASPILPCGCLCSLPIPSRPYEEGIPYSHIRFGGRSLQQICNELNPKWSHKNAHLDPDLCASALTDRPKGWKPAFGQCGPSASHLYTQGVSEGDLFIFFGWFRRTTLVDGRLQFCKDDKRGRHIIYGWLRVDEISEVNGHGLPAHLRFLEEHAHRKFVTDSQKTRPNRIYVGADAGLFPKVRKKLVLTKDGSQTRSTWGLPSPFESLYKQGEPDMTYHKNKKLRWSLERGQVCLETVARGQEFVIDCERHPRVCDYFVDLIRSSSAKMPFTCTHGLLLSRSLGSAKGEFTMPENFNEPDPEIEAMFYEGEVFPRGDSQGK